MMRWLQLRYPYQKTKKKNHEENLQEKKHEARNGINNNDANNNGVVDEQADEYTEDNTELEQFFQIQIEAIDHCSLLQLEPREKLSTVKLIKETKGSVYI